MTSAVSLPINVQPWLKYTATTVGRDKIYRAVQYFSRFLAWYLLRQGATKETVARFNNLKKTLGLSRKLMRFGKPIEHLENAAKATSVADDFLRYCTIGKQLAYAGYLTLDGIIFIDGSGAYKFKNIKKYSELASRFWLAGIVFGFVSGLYKTRQIQIRRESAARGLAHSGEAEKSKARTDLKSLAKEQHSVNKQLLQDGLDMLIPATGLGYLNLDDGAVGLIGTATAIMGAQTQWRKVNKA
ncbi:peroxisomal biogenesis factor 11 [Gamsiella multidivaricata]|uniref:peroxisomal biogenesis factor 11 n=1 Tax=Gamsiella multidivaricata TaxID=101098 RepID=UPI00221FF321|nr:peroxisomal biogenesis factor 11 [Gamsiella multidivaricata]KAG0361111.1 Peroxisomal membrane protein PMP27 [Gamsiella multidivaricata]KAI7829825.1 peroxisomal biogenesis factor 11 [Gamsiella multidivaricata]